MGTLLSKLDTYTLFHTYIHTFPHIHTYTLVHTYIHIFCPHIHTYLHTCPHIHVHLSTRTYIHTCPHIHVYLSTRTYTLVHTHIHTYVLVHTYIHTEATGAPTGHRDIPDRVQEAVAGLHGGESGLTPDLGPGPPNESRGDLTPGVCVCCKVKNIFMLREERCQGEDVQANN